MRRRASRAERTWVLRPARLALVGVWVPMKSQDTVTGGRRQAEPAFVLEQVPQTGLHLPGIPQPRPDRAVEVLVESGRRGVPEVVVIEQVEDLHQQLHLAAVTYPERARQPEVPGEEGVVAPDGVA